jgi:hypothetical protein
MNEIKSLHDLIQSFYGVETVHNINRTASSVGTTVSKICNSNPKRVYLTIINLSVNNVYVMFDGQVSSTRGIFISPSGGSFVLRWIDDFNLLSSEIYAVASANNSDLLIIEGVIL